jgi:hypothetical protein
MEDDVPGRDRRTWWIPCLVVLAAVGVGVGVWRLSQPPLPDQQEAQHDVAATVGRAEHTTVTAVCTVPDDDGYTCRLRDAAGRYGYSDTIFVTTDNATNPDDDEYVTTRDGETIWGFPLNADGTGTMTLDATPPRNLATSIAGALEMIGSSLRHSDPAGLFGAIDCAQPISGGATSCTVRAPVESAILRALGDDRFQLTYRVATS